MNELGQFKERDFSRDESEYNHLKTFEIELFKTRWTVFTTLLSISFVVTGVALRQMATDGASLFLKLLCSLGGLIYLVGFYHYHWFHHKAHALRQRLIYLESKLGYQIYTTRESSRPSFLGIALRFHWIINLLSIFYTVLLIFIWFWK